MTGTRKKVLFFRINPPEGVRWKIKTIIRENPNKYQSPRGGKVATEGTQNTERGHGSNPPEGVR